MIENLVEYTCDRCGRKLTQRAREEYPAAWSNVAVRTMEQRKNPNSQSYMGVTQGSNGFTDANEILLNKMICPSCTESLQEFLSNGGKVGNDL